MDINHSLSLGVYVLGVLAVIFAMLGSHFLGQRHSDRAKNAPYESGIIATGSARIRFPAHFYVIAMIFVVFDIEAIILFLWAVAAKTLGTFGLIQAALFSTVLFIGLLYVWRQGAFSFGPKLRQPQVLNEE